MIKRFQKGCVMYVFLLVSHHLNGRTIDSSYAVFCKKIVYECHDCYMPLKDKKSGANIVIKKYQLYNLYRSQSVNKNNDFDSLIYLNLLTAGVFDNSQGKLSYPMFHTVDLYNDSIYSGVDDVLLVETCFEKNGFIKEAYGTDKRKELYIIYKMLSLRYAMMNDHETGDLYYVKW